MQKQENESWALPKPLHLYTTKELHSLLLVRGLPKELLEKTEQARMAIVSLAQYCMEYRPLRQQKDVFTGQIVVHEDTLANAMNRKLLHLLAERVGDVIVEERLVDPQFDRLCRDYSKNDKDFLDLQKKTVGDLYKKWSTPVKIHSAPGLSTNTVTYFYPYEEKLGLLINKFSEQPELYITSAKNTNFYYPKNANRNIKIPNPEDTFKPQMSVFVQDVLRFVIGFSEVYERKSLEQKMQQDPSISNMLKSHLFDQEYPYLLAMSVLAWVPFGKAAKAAEKLWEFANKAENSLVRTFIKGCVENTPINRIAQPGELTMEHVSKFIKMDKTRKIKYISENILEKRYLPQWMKSINSIDIYDEVGEGSQFLANRAKMSKSKDILDLYSFFGNKKVPDLLYNPRSRIVQVGGGSLQNDFGMKIHITLPSLNQTEHYQLAEAVFDRLLWIRQQVGRDKMAFKFMTSSSSWRMNRSQFGKDFTIYFSDDESFRAAMPHLLDLDKELASIRSTTILFNSMGEAGMFIPPINIASETVFGTYIRGSIRNFSGKPLYISMADAHTVINNLGLNNNNAKKFIEYLNNFRNGNIYMFSDDALRKVPLEFSDQMNRFMYEAYLSRFLKLKP
ncbi:MAG: hypothetical protein N3F07_02830 [Candidatus Micrarchaeota archaeon]|nr:hypothetical protein [Candidatus Micrarchaeota archaeon]